MSIFPSIPTIPSRGDLEGSGSAASARSRSPQSRIGDTARFWSNLDEALKEKIVESSKRRERLAHGGANSGQTPTTEAQPAGNATAVPTANPDSSPTAAIPSDDDQKPPTQVADAPSEDDHKDPVTNEVLAEVAQSQAAPVTPAPVPAAATPQPTDETAPLPTTGRSTADRSNKEKSISPGPVLTKQDPKDAARNQESDSNQSQQKRDPEPQVNTSPPQAAVQVSDKSKHSKTMSPSERQSVEAKQSASSGKPGADIAAQPQPQAPESPVASAPTTLKPIPAMAIDSSTDAKTQISPVIPSQPSITALTEPADVAPPAQDSPATTASDPMDQVVLGLKSKLDARTGKAEIRLDPPNLGAVKVSLSLDSGSLTAQFESSSEMVRDLLKSNLDKLKTVLEGQGVSVDRLAVEPPATAQSQDPGASFGSATHDGRSAGQYHQDSRSSRHGQDADGFATLFREVQDAPLDLVA